MVDECLLGPTLPLAQRRELARRHDDDRRAAALGHELRLAALRGLDDGTEPGLGILKRPFAARHGILQLVRPTSQMMPMVVRPVNPAAWRRPRTGAAPSWIAAVRASAE